MKMEMKEKFSTKKNPKIWLILIMEVVGNESNQEKLLPTCTNVMADCQNSIMQEKKHQAVCLQSESDRATLIWLE